MTYRPRGNLEKILKYELPGFSCHSVGKHGRTFLTKVIYNLYREAELLKYYKKNSIEITCGFGPLATISSKYFKIPSLVFEDDFEYKINFYYARVFATRHIMPNIFPVKGKNVYYYNGFKELAYLHPNYYSPNIRSLEEYDLNRGEYIFIREVAGVSLNYKNKKSRLNEIIQNIKNFGLKIVLSLEDDKLKDRFREDNIILEEPVKDIKSIMAFAALTITSGDTMARESCLLGTNTIYTGDRKMLIHEDFYNVGIMYNEVEIPQIIKCISKLLNYKENTEKRDIVNDMILNKWDDMTSVIIKHISEFIS